MGGCKDNMKTTKAADNKDTGNVEDKGKGFLGILPRKRKQEKSTAKTFADMVEMIDKKIDELIIQKEVELKNEFGRENYNKQALAILKTIQFHKDEIIEQMAQYNELK
jgi:hypothetical protein